MTSCSSALNASTNRKRYCELLGGQTAELQHCRGASPDLWSRCRLAATLRFIPGFSNLSFCAISLRRRLETHRGETNPALIRTEGLGLFIPRPCPVSHRSHRRVRGLPRVRFIARSANGDVIKVSDDCVPRGLRHFVMICAEFLFAVPALFWPLTMVQEGMILFTCTWHDLHD
jgi:hypothetical protein